VFLLTFILEKSGWTLSRYVASILGEGEVFVDYGLMTAPGLFYMLPALLLCAIAHKYLVRPPFGVDAPGGGLRTSGMLSTLMRTRRARNTRA
jgi:hypothetical protein